MVINVQRSVLQPVLDALPGQVALLDHSGQIVVANDAWIDNTSGGPLVRGVVGSNYLATCDRELASGIQDVLHGRSNVLEVEYPTIIDNKPLWFSISFRPYDDGRLRGALASHGETARVEHDEQVLDALLNAAPPAIITIDLECKVTRWNRAAERMFGWSEDEVLGTFLPIVPEEARDAFLANVANAIDAREHGASMQIRRQRKDGKLLDVSIASAGIRDVSGKLTGVLGILTDITDRVRADSRQRFLLEASEILTKSFDYEQTLVEVIDLAVQLVADMCGAYLLDDVGGIRRIAVAHRDPDKLARVRTFAEQHPVPAALDWGTAGVIRSGKPEIRHWLSDTPTSGQEHVDLLLQLGATSTLIVPLIARESVIGAISFVYCEDGRTYEPEDLVVAQALADRVANTIDNSRLISEARDAEQLFRAIIEHVPAVTYIADPFDLSRILYINSQGEMPERWVGDPPVEDGIRWTNSLHPEDAERTIRAMRESSVTGEPLVVEYRIIDKDDVLSWRLDRAHLVYDHDGNRLHWQGVAVVITEQKLAEEKLAVRARQQAAIARLTTEAVGDVDFKVFTQRAVAVANEILGTEYASLILYDDNDEMLRVRAVDGTVLGSGVGHPVRPTSATLSTYTLRTKAPVIVGDLESETRFTPWVGMVQAGIRSGVSVVVPGREHPMGVLLVVTREKRRFTDEDVNVLQSIANLVSTTMEHARHEERLRFQAHLLDVILQAVVATDAEGRITYWNRHAQTIYGWSAHEIIGNRLLEVAPANDSVTHFEAMFESARGGDSSSADIPMKHRDGSVFHGWSVLAPLHDHAGRLQGIIALSADISERMRAHAERDQLLRELGERVKELTVLRQAAALLENEDLSIAAVLNAFAAMLPDGMQFPHLAVACISVGPYVAESCAFVDDLPTIETTFSTPVGPGSIRVGYVRNLTSSEDDPFLIEERALIETIADMLRAWLRRVHAGEQLRKSEARMRAATEGTLNAFAIFEPIRNDHRAVVDYRISDANQRAEEMLRRTREQLIGNCLRELFTNEQAQMFIDAFNTVNLSGQAVERELKVPRTPDEFFWMRFQAVPLGDGIAAFATDTTEQRRLEDQLMHQAFHDSLTGLPNRALFMDRVEHARGRGQRRNEGVAVMFLDLDNFKIINDSLGHGIGDLLLVEVAQRISACIGPGNTAARFGGDEFAVLLEDLWDWASAAEMAEEILDSFHTPFIVDGRQLYVTPSIGVAIASSLSATSSDLLRYADTAMYRAKRSGKARVAVFDPSHSDDAVERFELENDLRRAIEREEFSVVYQPIVGLESNEILAFEALVRWDHPLQGRMSPAQFISVAEETGLIVPIGRKVLSTACAEAVEWNRIAGRRVRVSVNISPRQFRHPEIVEQVLEVLAETCLEPSLLFLEITESLMVEDVDLASDTLRRLRETGVHIAVDDFGTGYSSLGSLRQLPVEVVKIDRVFVSGVESNDQDAAMLSSIVDLAHRLDLVVVAEGVETAAQREWLRAMGCDLAQGYLFSYPLPPEGARGLL